MNKSTKKWTYILVLCIILSLFLIVKNWLLMPVTDQIMNVKSVLGTSDNNENFAKAIAPIPFHFPIDAGAHPDFKSEWWYYTGNLENQNGSEFGYQFTIFRQSISDKNMKTASDWRTNQVYMVHMAVTDVENNRFYSGSTMTRGAAGLAGATIDPYRIWVENNEISDDYNHPVIKAGTGEFSFEFQLNSVKPIVLNGNQGLSQKSKSIGNASYYYSQTRLKTKGQLTINGNKYTVSGESWLDREWGTSSLGENEIGWDWFSIQLHDNREIMLYSIRQKGGKSSGLSSGTFTNSTGDFYHLKKSDFSVEVLKKWQSERTNLEYPAQWRIKIPNYEIDILVTPKINNQEHQLQFTYWEGAVNISGENIDGSGYVELVGY